MAKPFDPGQMIACFRFRDFDALIDSWKLFRTGRWIFRGQERAQYKLVSRFCRLMHEAGVPLDEWVWREGQAIGYFKDQARVHLTQTPDDKDLIGWLSLMQHYGAPTRLMDWTTSPFIAFHFALPMVADGEGAIWAMNLEWCDLFCSRMPYDHTGMMKLVLDKEDEAQPKHSKC